MNSGLYSSIILNGIYFHRLRNQNSPGIEVIFSYSAEIVNRFLIVCQAANVMKELKIFGKESLQLINIAGIGSIKENTVFFMMVS
nr:hypothetical protein [Chryseobacterium elymi]